MNKFSKIVSLCACAAMFSSCGSVEKENWFDNAVETAHYQLLSQAEELKSFPAERQFARTVKNDTLITTNASNWTSGFLPGNFWLGYELTKDEKLAKEARMQTNKMEDIKNLTRTHDLGFMMFCSYGQANRLAPEPTDADIIVKSSESLCTRFNPEIKAIRSWDSDKWNYPVIIDNMMNLEMLFWASEESGNDEFRKIAETHANTTLANHFREDATSYHVISYNNDGTVESKGTHQGYSDSSAWARGQAWGLYGYVMCYRFTNNPAYLAQAEKIAKYTMENRPAEDDFVPYWDYNAPNIPNEPRDASAAAISASALLELQKYVDNGDVYLKYAENILKDLSSEKYLAKKGEIHGFILKHSTGHLPAGYEIDAPINYADYYYLEALTRYKAIMNK